MNTRLILFLLVCPAIGKTQEFAITNKKENTFYVGRPNEVAIAANKFECKDIIVSLSYGEAKLGDDSCNYVILLDRPGKILLSLYSRKTNELIGSEEYRVKYLPEPYTYIAGRSMGDIKKKILLVQLGIIADHFPNIDIDARFKIEHFSVAIRRSDSTIFVRDVIGPYFDDNVKAAFENLKDGDKITFYNITGKGIDNVVRHLIDKEFNIVE